MAAYAHALKSSPAELGRKFVDTGINRGFDGAVSTRVQLHIWSAQTKREMKGETRLLVCLFVCARVRWFVCVKA